VKIYRHFSDEENNFLAVNNRQKDPHRPSPSGFRWMVGGFRLEKRPFFADRHRKVKQSEHLLSIVFIYLDFLWIKSGRGEGREAAMFTK